MKKRGLIVLLAIATLAFTGCGDSSESESYNSTEAYSTGEYYSYFDDVYSDGFDYLPSESFSEKSASSTYGDTQDDYELDESSDDNVTDEDDFDLDTEVTADRKLIYESDIDIETKAFDDDVASIKNLVTEYNGYLESTSVSGSKDQGSRSAYFTARIPADNYSGFINSAGSIGSVTYLDENVDDITSDYVDVQARLSSLNTKLERLKELEQNAETVDDLLEIEDRIDDVQYLIESYTAQLKTFDNKVSYCTVDISISEVVTYTEIKKDTFGTRAAAAILDSLDSFIVVIEGVLIGLIYVLPYIVVVLIIVLIVLICTRKSRKARKQLRKQYSQRPVNPNNMMPNQAPNTPVAPQGSRIYNGPSYSMNNMNSNMANPNQVTNPEEVKPEDTNNK